MYCCCHSGSAANVPTTRLAAVESVASIATTSIGTLTSNLNAVSVGSLRVAIRTAAQAACTSLIGENQGGTGHRTISSVVGQSCATTCAAETGSGPWQCARMVLIMTQEAAQFSTAPAGQGVRVGVGYQYDCANTAQPQAEAYSGMGSWAQGVASGMYCCCHSGSATWVPTTRIGALETKVSNVENLSGSSTLVSTLSPVGTAGTLLYRVAELEAPAIVYPVPNAVHSVAFINGWVQYSDGAVYPVGYSIKNGRVQLRGQRSGEQRRNTHARSRS